MLPDPRATLIELGPFKLSWVEIILLLSAVIASAEILKVSEPGVDNTGEVIAMGLVAVIQFGLVIASLYDQKFVIFKTTESLMMLIINVVQTYVAFRVQLTFARPDNRRRVCDRRLSLGVVAVRRPTGPPSDDHNICGGSQIHARLAF